MTSFPHNVIAAPATRMNVLTDLRQRLTTPRLRPWALITPIAVLLVCLPLLRPLRHTDPRTISSEELALLDNTRGLVEDHASSTPPAATLLPLLLSVPYLFLHDLGITFAKNPELAAYLLTLIGAALPVALCAGLIYRMGRIFELSRPRRALLACATVFGSGLVSYGVVLNAHAPACALLLAAAAAISHLACSKNPRTTTALILAGLCASLAAMIDPAAIIFLILLAFTPLFLRRPIAGRALGMMLYIVAAAGPIALHAATSDVPLTRVVEQQFARPASPSHAAHDDLDDAVQPANRWDTLGHHLARITNAFVGGHGIFSHFPIVILGLFGVAGVMHRHWPMTIKALATATLAGAAVLIITACLVTLAGPGRMFGPQSFILFLPLVLFWSGAWLRRPHHAFKWTLVAVLFVFSTAVTLIGATDPFPRDGYDRYTPAQALHNLRHPASLNDGILAGR